MINSPLTSLEIDSFRVFYLRGCESYFYVKNKQKIFDQLIEILTKNTMDTNTESEHEEETKETSLSAKHLLEVELELYEAKFEIKPFEYPHPSFRHRFRHVLRAYHEEECKDLLPDKKLKEICSISGMEINEKEKRSLAIYFLFELMSRSTFAPTKSYRKLYRFTWETLTTVVKILENTDDFAKDPGDLQSQAIETARLIASLGLHSFKEQIRFPLPIVRSEGCNWFDFIE
jgi:hypothetical protein